MVCLGVALSALARNELSDNDSNGAAGCSRVRVLDISCYGSVIVGITRCALGNPVTMHIWKSAIQGSYNVEEGPVVKQWIN